MLNLFIFITCFLILLGYLFTKKILNPVTIFNFIWLFIILLYQLRLSSLQEYLNNNTYILFLINNTSFSLTFLFNYIIKPKKNYKKINDEKVIGYNTVKKIFIIWLIVELVEIVYSGGIPIIWLLKGSSKTYMEFGITTVHGLMNSLGLILILLCWYLILFGKDTTKIYKKNLIKIILFILLFYFCIITRQVIISAVIEMFSLYLFYKKNFPWKKFILLIIIGVISFGIIGNMRTGYDGFLNVSGFHNNNINKLFIGIYWVYMYLTMTVANINNAVAFNVVGYGAYPIVKNFLPTIFSDFLFSNSTIVVPSIYVTPAFNVSGYFKEFFIGYGTFGVIVISAIYGLLGSIIYKKFLKNKTEKNMLYYSIYLQIILLSFFANHLLYLPSGFQLVIVYYLFRGRRNK